MTPLQSNSTAVVFYNGTLFWGGDSDDSGKSITVDSSGNVYIAGGSSATWGSPLLGFGGGDDAFATMLNSSGTLQWNTFFGSSGSEIGQGVKVDSSGNVYVAGNSSSTWGSPVRVFSSGSDAFIVLFGEDTTPPTASITYSTPGPYKSGDSVTITATFNEPMADAPVPQISISGANTLAATNMTKFSTTVYTYLYTVGAGNGTATIAMSTGTDVATNVVTSAPTSGADFTVDNEAPIISITNPNTDPATSKTITATTSDGTLTMSNTTGVICNGTLTFIAYASQTFTQESDNGTKVCYKATDAIGNIAYSMSNAIAGIDITAPTITITNPNTNPATSKTITATTSDGTLTMSNTTGSTCDGTLTFIAYASQTFTQESDNGTKVCYKATDAIGNIAYSMSNAIAGIDITAPPIPTATPVGATYTSTQSITLVSLGSSAIYYTINGSIPTTSSTIYIGAISISSTTTLKALSVDSIGNESSIMTETYTIETAPVVNPTPHGGVSHLECSNQKCIYVSGEGGNMCNQDIDCQTPTHTECDASNKCLLVMGAGNSNCQTDAECSACSPKGDINKNSRIDVTDFSILLYYWKQLAPKNPCVDINKDNVVNVTDFSIMLYWWTK